jgi:hypothetical protein
MVAEDALEKGQGSGYARSIRAGHLSSVNGVDGVPDTGRRSQTSSYRKRDKTSKKKKRRPSKTGSGVVSSPFGTSAAQQNPAGDQEAPDSLPDYSSMAGLSTAVRKLKTLKHAFSRNPEAAEVGGVVLSTGMTRIRFCSCVHNCKVLGCMLGGLLLPVCKCARGFTGSIVSLYAWPA